MGHLWSLKKQLCSALALQPYALLLKGYMEGSTHVIFHISQCVLLDKDQLAAMFVGAKRAGLYPHSITTGLGTAQEVSQWDLLHLTPHTDLAEVLHAVCVCVCLCVCVCAGPQIPSPPLLRWNTACWMCCQRSSRGERSEVKWRASQWLGRSNRCASRKT